MDHYNCTYIVLEAAVFRGEVRREGCKKVIQVVHSKGGRQGDVLGFMT